MDHWQERVRGRIWHLHVLGIRLACVQFLEVKSFEQITSPVGSFGLQREFYAVLKGCDLPVFRKLVASVFSVNEALLE